MKKTYTKLAVSVCDLDIIDVLTSSTGGDKVVAGDDNVFGDGWGLPEIPLN